MFYTLRERATEAERNLRRSERNEERSRDGSLFEASNDSNDHYSKKSKKTDGRGAKYDSEGVHKELGIDLCDCLDEECEGCWNPCPKCSSTKCGHECRKNRKWQYDKYNIEGTNICVKHPSKK